MNDYDGTQGLIHYFSMAPMVHLYLTVAQSKQINTLQETDKMLILTVVL